MLLYIIYSNALSIGRVWLERAVVPEWIGLWWAHGILALLALTLLARAAGVFVRERPLKRSMRERLEPSA